MSEQLAELKPCPWCGKVPDVNDPRTFWVDDSVGGKWGAVQCCGIGPDVRTGYGPVAEWREEAIAAWNHRADSVSEEGNDG